MSFEFVMNKGVADALGITPLVSPTYEGKPVLSADQAHECLVIVRGLLGTDEAQLYPPGHEGPMWVISLEGWEDWAIRLSELTEEFPDGVFVEPVTGWCLGLYPAS